MNLFIDESGSFVDAASPGAYNSVVAYVSPEFDRKRLQNVLSRLKASCGVPRVAEIKLRQTSEAAYFEFLRTLAECSGVLYAVATDAGVNQYKIVLEHQEGQASKVVEHKNKILHEEGRRAVQSVSDRLSRLSPQLYVQLFCQIHLISAILSSGVLYFVQRHPQCLGRFRWKIDQKNSTRTQFETMFVTLAPALVQSMSLRDPFPALIGADYSRFDRFKYPPGEEPTWLEDQYGIEIDSSRGKTNVGMIIHEDLRFVDSKQSYGVQVADLLASGIRRCLRQEFENNEKAAFLLGRLMVQKDAGEPPIRLLGFAQVEQPVSSSEAKLINIMTRSCHPMVI